LITCHLCGQTQEIEPLASDTVAECQRCGATLLKARSDSLRRTAALSLAALLFYVPANIYPVLRMDLYGVHSDNTVCHGVVQLYQDGEWFIGTIVFLASLAIPLLKLLGLFFLVVTTRIRTPYFRRARALLLRVIVAVGPWAMLDVFLLAILVALVRLGKFATVTPGPGIVAFASVVVLTIFASASFDPKQIWQSEGAAQ
jgi:paraquat-inducible protein A